MRIDGKAEYNNWGKIDWIPGVSFISGLFRLIHSIFEPSKYSIKGRIQFWGNIKRGAAALFPVFGNALIIWHDYRIRKELNQIEDQLHKATQEKKHEVFAQFPEEIKNSSSQLHKLVKDEANLLNNKNFLLHYVKVTDEDLFTTHPNLVSRYQDDQDIVIEMAKRNLDNLKHATKLMEDADFVLKAAKELYDDSFQSFCFTAAPKRPSYMKSLPILKYAPKLCQNADFMLKAKIQPYLNPIEHAVHFKDDGDFILKMMKGYSEPGGWFRGTMSGINLHNLHQSIPLEKLATDKLRGDLEFMRKAISIEPKAQEFATDTVKIMLSVKDKPELNKLTKHVLECTETLLKIKIPSVNLNILPGDPERGWPLPKVKNKEDANPVVPIRARPQDIFHSVNLEKGMYYSYHSQGFDGNDWSCAWNVIQTIVSFVIEGVPSLEVLFNIFGKKENLCAIYKDLYKMNVEDEQFKRWDRAPYDHSEGWADQFVAQMVLHAFGVKSLLGVIHGDPNAAPLGDSSKCITFNDFETLKSKLFEHFQNEKALPVLIDNGTYTMCILGIGEDNDSNIKLWIADPHKKRQNEVLANPNWFSYTITLDKTGKRSSPFIEGELAMLSKKGGYKAVQFSEPTDQWGFTFAIKP